MNKLKINFFAREGDFLAESFRIEQLLSSLGRVSSIRTGTIAQFRLSTELGIGAVREKIDHLSLSGPTTISEEEENDEMAPA